MRRCNYAYSINIFINVQKCGKGWQELSDTRGYTHSVVPICSVVDGNVSKLSMGRIYFNL
jgi:hypothetical protein